MTVGFFLRSSGKSVILALIPCVVLNKYVLFVFISPTRVIIAFSIVAFCDSLLTTVISQIYYQS